ncbi:MAG: hypothetical protein L0Y60_02745 [Beijerinckiaceae bacterium]|nr:hypothetical protein [Beijerinckiaceae bacterium]
MSSSELMMRGRGGTYISAKVTGFLANRAGLSRKTGRFRFCRKCASRGCAAKRAAWPWH